MTRTEAIAVITARLDTADEATVLAIADILTGADDPIRSLTQHELALVAQSKADFATGNTVTLSEAMANITDELARRRARGRPASVP